MSTFQIGIQAYVNLFLFLKMAFYKIWEFGKFYHQFGKHQGIFLKSLFQNLWVERSFFFVIFDFWDFFEKIFYKTGFLRFFMSTLGKMDNLI